MRTVKYFSYRGDHLSGKGSTSHPTIDAALCSRVIMMAHNAKERGEKEITFRYSITGAVARVPMPHIKVVKSDSSGTTYEITMSDKSWRKLGAHV